MNNLNDNLNALSPIGFRLAIDSTRFANLEYFLTSVEFPELTLGESPSPFRNEEGYYNGDTIVFNPLTVTFLIDEDMKNYEEIYKWIHDNRVGISFADATLIIMTSHNNPNRQVKFIDCFPTALSGNTFDIQATDVQYLKATLTLRYDYFEIIK